MQENNIEIRIISIKVIINLKIYINNDDDDDNNNKINK